MNIVQYKRQRLQQINQVIQQIIQQIIFRSLNQNYFLKKKYDPVIPLNIYQTWHTKILPPKMKQRVELLKAQNPRFNHYLYDDKDCYEFIKNNFEEKVAKAYERLIPGAYKADLWRLCILYINGGFYLDIKLCCINGFKLIELSENEHYVKDRPHKSIYNALMVCKKGNIFLLKSINKIVENVENKYYGNSPLDPTGPCMLGSIIERDKSRSNVDLLHYNEGRYLIYKNRFVVSIDYPGYYDEMHQTYRAINKKRYTELWHERKIYK